MLFHAVILSASPTASALEAGNTDLVIHHAWSRRETIRFKRLANEPGYAVSIFNISHIYNNSAWWQLSASTAVPSHLTFRFV